MNGAYFSTKTYVVGTQNSQKCLATQKCLDKAPKMSTYDVLSYFGFISCKKKVIMEK